MEGCGRGGVPSVEAGGRRGRGDDAGLLWVCQGLSLWGLWWGRMGIAHGGWFGLGEPSPGGATVLTLKLPLCTGVGHLLMYVVPCAVGRRKRGRPEVSLPHCCLFFFH